MNNVYQTDLLYCATAIMLESFWNKMPDRRILNSTDLLLDPLELSKLNK